MPEQRSDKTLLLDIAEGDRDALGELYDRFASDMMAVGHKFLSDDSIVEEVIHDVFLEVWRSAHTYDDERGSVRTWLMVRMRSRSLDKLDYENRRNHEDIGDAPVEDLETTEGHPGTLLRREWIRESVRDLPEKLRDVLIGTYYYGMTGRELSDELDIPVGTVRSRLRTARQKVRESVDDGRST